MNRALFAVGEERTSFTLALETTAELGELCPTTLLDGDEFVFFPRQRRFAIFRPLSRDAARMFVTPRFVLRRAAHVYFVTKGSRMLALPVRRASLWFGERDLAAFLVEYGDRIPGLASATLVRAFSVNPFRPRFRVLDRHHRLLQPPM